MAARRHVRSPPPQHQPGADPRTQPDQLPGELRLRFDRDAFDTGTAADTERLRPARPPSATRYARGPVQESGRRAGGREPSAVTIDPTAGTIYTPMATAPSRSSRLPDKGRIKGNAGRIFRAL